ncbi:MAG: hypothetical protein J6M56_13260 [Clostridia bacterium]|nr:hypothetical protein [Clostridia bacterium]
MKNSRPAAHPAQAAKREFFQQYQVKRKTANGAKHAGGLRGTKRDSDL